MKKLLTIVIALMTFTAVAQKAECHFTESKFIKASGKTIESEGNLKLTSADKEAGTRAAMREMADWQDFFTNSIPKHVVQTSQIGIPLVLIQVGLDGCQLLQCRREVNLRELGLNFSF